MGGDIGGTGDAGGTLLALTHWEGRVQRPNPWYGIFLSEWLDVWCGGEEGEAKVVDQVMCVRIGSNGVRLPGPHVKVRS